MILNTPSLLAPAGSSRPALSEMDLIRHLLSGPERTGKVALVRSFGRVLAGAHPLHCQIMTGHAWWAVRNGDVAFCTEAQTRLNTEKILALIEAASWSENAESAFIACLVRISPGELFGFFAEVAYQLQHGQVMRLPMRHLESPRPCPANFFLIGAMDTAAFDWSDPALLSQTSVIHWSSAVAQSPDGHDHDEADTAVPGDWLHRVIRNVPAARRKLAHLLPRPCRTLRSLWRDLALALHQATLAAAITRDSAIYLANAWSEAGEA
jgi:hypothetical protein